MGYFPDFAQTSRLGFQAGAEMGQGQNPLGIFIRSMLADWQQKRAVGQEVGLYKAKKGYEQELEEKTQIVKEERERTSPLYAAQTEAYKALGAQRTEGLIDEQIKKDAWEKYQTGDRSPETLKSLGKWVSPMEAMFAQSMGFGGIDNTAIPTGKSSSKSKQSHKIGQIIKKGNTNYKVVSFDSDGEPLVEKVK